jgi:hypothetical protein
MELKKSRVEITPDKLQGSMTTRVNVFSMQLCPTAVPRSRVVRLQKQTIKGKFIVVGRVLGFSLK